MIQHSELCEAIINCAVSLASRSSWESVTTLENQQKFHHLMMAWLEPLAINQKVTRQMILNKLEPGHLHIQIPALLRISRTVQWLREAADQHSTLPWRAVDETALTGVYLITFCCWLTDNTSMYQISIINTNSANK